MNPLKDAKYVNEYVLKTRRYFHMYPELSFQENNTKNKIIELLKAMKVDVVNAGNNSVLAYINKGKKGKTIAFRCEMDALPIQENSKYPYPSTVGNVSHMCGHDAHMAMLLGVIKRLKALEDKISGSILFIFEEANESYHGASMVMTSNILEGVDFIFTQHVIPQLYCGEVAIRNGLQLMGSDKIEIEWLGEATHTSLPEEAKDTILAASNFTNNVQTMVSRAVNPRMFARVMVTKFLAGSSHNIVSNYAQITLNLRYDNLKVRDKVLKSIYDYVDLTSAIFNVKNKVKMAASSYPSYNDKNIVALAKKAISTVSSDISIVDMPPLLFSDDYSVYLEKIPGAMGLLGVGFRGESNYSNHHESFYMNEDALIYGVAWYLEMAYSYFGIKVK